jgi:hypothetical protein
MSPGIGSSDATLTGTPSDLRRPATTSAEAASEYAANSCHGSLKCSTYDAQRRRCAASNGASPLRIGTSDGMDSPRSFGIIVPAGVMWCECQRNQEESEMNATTVAVDLAKNLFQLAYADASLEADRDAATDPAAVSALLP